MDKKKKGRVTPEWIDDLQENQVFVFGSNLAGMHGGGAARVARLRFGAVMGKGVGMQGRSYAIPTMQGGTETIRPYVNDFIAYAKEHPELTFLVTPIGCGIAGFGPRILRRYSRKRAMWRTSGCLRASGKCWSS